MSVTEVFLRRPVLGWMLMASVLLAGAVAVTRIGIGLQPNYAAPSVTMSVDWPGASPESVERVIVDALENRLGGVEGLQHMESVASAGGAEITLSLDAGRDADAAVLDVQLALSGVNTLPRDATAPRIAKGGGRGGEGVFMWVMASGPFAQTEFADLMKYRIKDAVQGTPGVSGVMLFGQRGRAIRVWVDNEKLSRLDLTASDVVAAFKREHVDYPAGTLEKNGRAVSLWVAGEATTLAQLRAMPLAPGKAGAPRLQDVALVEDGLEDLTYLARVDGKPALGLGISARHGANLVSVARAVHDKLDALQADTPGITLRVMYDGSKQVRQAVQHMGVELSASVGLTALVCWLFLGSLRSATSALLAIPMSLAGSVAVIYFCGFTLNTYTLMALTLSVGLVVDDAIMVLDSIFRRRETEPDAYRAAALGTADVRFAAMAATIGVIAIFAPLIFVRGKLGMSLREFGVTLSVGMLLSYVEAITLAPVRTAQLLSDVRVTHEQTRMDRWLAALARRQDKLLQRTLRAPVSATLLILLGLGFTGYAVRTIPVQLFTFDPPNRLFLRVDDIPGTALDATSQKLLQLEAKARALPGVTSVLTQVMGDDGVNRGVIMATLADKSDLKTPQFVLQQQLMRAVDKNSGLQVKSWGGSDLTFSIQGADWSTLREQAERAISALSAREDVMRGVVVDAPTAPRLRVVPDRDRCAQAGVPVETIASTVESLFGARQIGQFGQDSHRLPVMMRLAAEQRRDVGDIDSLFVRNMSGERVALGSLVHSDRGPGTPSLTRINRQRALSVDLALRPDADQAAIIDALHAMEKSMPRGYRVTLGQDTANAQGDLHETLLSIGLGVLIAYMVLASQFNAFGLPLVTLVLLPFSAVGAVVALKLSHMPLSLYAFVGIFLLIGIVKKNAILLVDRAAHNERQNMDAVAALREACSARLRPILMTSVATLTAAIPTALGLGENAATRQPLAVALCGGLFLSTLLTLVVVPAAYLTLRRFDDFRKRIWHP